MLECPKCAGELVTKERSGIMIEECDGCRGVYLDRGELERLIDAESEYLAKLPTSETAETIYQGRHRHGVVQQVFGTPDQAAGAEPGEPGPTATAPGNLTADTQAPG